MKQDRWLQKGLDEVRENHYFDGYQMLQGAIQRAFRFNELDHVETIISEAVPLFTLKNQGNLACELVNSLVTIIKRRSKEQLATKMIAVSFENLRKVSLEKCVQTVCNQIIIGKSFQDSKFLSHLNSLILEANFNDSVISNLYYCYAGLLCQKKDFMSCFKTIHAWSKNFCFLSQKLRTYITLAEINAYEIDGCGKYLQSENKDISRKDISSKTESLNYLEIANRIFSAVQNQDASEFYSVTNDFSDLINTKTDALLKVLCDGISEIFRSKSSNGLLSMFKP